MTSSLPGLEKLFDSPRWTRDDSKRPPLHNRPTHRLRMTYEQVDHGLYRIDLVDIEAEFPKGADMHQFNRSHAKKMQELTQIDRARGLLQVVNNVDLDVAVAQNTQRAL